MSAPEMTAAERAAFDQSGAGAKADLNNYVEVTRLALAEHDWTDVAVVLAAALREASGGQVRGLLMAAIFELAKS